MVWHVQRVGYHPNYEPFPLTWPEYPNAFLSLEPFIGDSEAGFIIVEGLDLIDLQHRFPSMPSVGLHRENNTDYVLILRPMLPHEGVNDLMVYLSIPSPASSTILELPCVQ